MVDSWGLWLRHEKASGQSGNRRSCRDLIHLMIRDPYGIAATLSGCARRCWLPPRRGRQPDAGLFEDGGGAFVGQPSPASVWTFVSPGRAGVASQPDIATERRAAPDAQKTYSLWPPLPMIAPRLRGRSRPSICNARIFPARAAVSYNSRPSVFSRSLMSSLVAGFPPTGQESHRIVVDPLVVTAAGHE